MLTQKSWQIAMALPARRERRDPQNEMHDIEVAETTQTHRRGNHPFDRLQRPAPFNAQHDVSTTKLSRHTVRHSVHHLVAEFAQSRCEGRLDTGGFIHEQNPHVQLRLSAMARNVRMTRPTCSGTSCGPRGRLMA